MSSLTAQLLPVYIYIYIFQRYVYVYIYIYTYYVFQAEHTPQTNIIAFC